MENAFENDPRYDAMAAVKFAINGSPVEFEDMVNAGLAARVINSVDIKREEVAKGLFGGPEMTQDAEPIPMEIDNGSPVDEVEETLNTDEEINVEETPKEE